MATITYTVTVATGTNFYSANVNKFFIKLITCKQTQIHFHF